MRILSLNDALPPSERSVVTVGNFDGVHLGHQELLKETVRRAHAGNSLSVAITFDPHTRQSGQHQTVYRILSTFDEKVRLIEPFGLDYLMRIPFDQAMSAKPPEEFVCEILVNKLRCTGWVMGQGHAVGINRTGDENFLRLLEGKYHFSMFVTDLLAIGGTSISSTRIRDLIMQGRIAEAVPSLGRPYLVLVERTRGMKLGTSLGYPTLNFKSPPSHKVIPPPGVYAAEMQYRGCRERGALYFGDCPTLRERREVHFEFFSFNRGEYDIPEGELADLWLHSFMRTDRQYGSMEELRAGIASDVEMIRNYFNKEKVQCR